MEMYVNELPKSCKECHLCNKNPFYWCYAFDKPALISDCTFDMERLKDCPLKPISEVKKQERERMIELCKPKRVAFKKWSGYRTTRFFCPNCRKNIETNIGMTSEYHCKYCGQSVIYPKVRVVNNHSELYFEEQESIDND